MPHIVTVSHCAPSIPVILNLKQERCPSTKKNIKICIMYIQSNRGGRNTFSSSCNPSIKITLKYEQKFRWNKLFSNFPEAGVITYKPCVCPFVFQWCLMCLFSYDLYCSEVLDCVADQKGGMLSTERSSGVDVILWLYLFLMSTENSHPSRGSCCLLTFLPYLVSV